MGDEGFKVDQAAGNYSDCFWVLGVSALSVGPGGTGEREREGRKEIAIMSFSKFEPETGSEES